MKTHFEMFAAYNAWANEKVFTAAKALPDSDYRRDEKAFFGSVHDTLNHLLVADQIWMARFTGDGPTHDRLDIVLYDDLRDLRAARQAEDRRIINWISSLKEDDFIKTYTYTPITTPDPVTTHYAPTLAHFFNHQTHHRGQVHALLTRLTDAAPSLDLVYYQYERKEEGCC